MVNVPGRSKGCATCRRRKKGCDCRRPTCLRCEKAGVPCEGYEKKAIFVDYKPPSQVAKSSSPRSDSSASSPSSPHGLPQVGWVTSAVLDPPNLLQEHVELQILDNFLDAFLPDTSFPSRTGYDPTPFGDPWKRTLRERSAAHPLIREAAAALGLSKLGSSSSDNELPRQGARMYGNALMRLNHSLQQNRAKFPDLLIAIMLMGIFEQFNGFSTQDNPKASRNWHAHVAGIQRLIVVQGPRAFQDDEAFAAFRATQLLQFTCCFSARKACPLATKEWRTIPWLGREKTCWDEFFDIVLPLPALLEQADESNTLFDSQKTQNIIRTLLQMRLKLIQWWSALESNARRRDSQQRLHDEGGQLPTLQENLFRWLDLNTIAVVLQCASVQIHILILLCNLIALLPSHISNTWDIYLVDALPFARLILRTIPPFLQQNGLFGSQCVLFPIGAVRYYTMQFALYEPETVKELGRDLNSTVGLFQDYKHLASFLKYIPTIRAQLASEVACKA